MDKNEEVYKVTIEEFIELQIHEMFVDLGSRLADGEFGEMTEDEMAGVPLGLFRAENHLLRAWLEFLEPEDEK